VPKKTLWADHNTYHDVFLHKELPFVGEYDCTHVKICSGISFICD